MVARTAASACWCTLFCFVLHFNSVFLRLYPEIFDQRRAHEHQGNITRVFILYFSSPYTGNCPGNWNFTAAVLVRLGQRGLPGIILSNVRSLSNKLDELQLLLGRNRDFSASAVLCCVD